MRLLYDYSGSSKELAVNIVEAMSAFLITILSNLSIISVTPSSVTRKSGTEKASKNCSKNKALTYTVSVLPDFCIKFSKALIESHRKNVRNTLLAFPRSDKRSSRCTKPSIKNTPRRTIHFAIKGKKILSKMRIYSAEVLPGIKFSTKKRDKGTKRMRGGFE